MTEDLNAMPLATADLLCRDKIQHHREEMSRWRLLRAGRITAERAKGRTVGEIANEIGTHGQVVYDLLKFARVAAGPEQS